MASILQEESKRITVKFLENIMYDCNEKRENYNIQVFSV